MKKSLLRKLQVVFLFAAVALTGVAFLPTDADAAITGTCEEINCWGGPIPCGIVIDPYSGERIRCKMPCT